MKYLINVKNEIEIIFRYKLNSVYWLMSKVVKVNNNFEISNFINFSLKNKGKLIWYWYDIKF